MRRGFKQFCKVTTLHGFKYLRSPFYFDRAWWAAWCCAGAGCAGALCAVLWARFLQVPALLTVDNMSPAASYMPAVGVCLSPDRVAQLILENIPIKPNRTLWLPVLLNRILRGKEAASTQLQLLQNLLVANNLTLSEALLRHTPPCAQLLRACEWQDVPIDCGALFRQRLTSWGACCLMEPPNAPENISTQMLRDNTKVNQNLQLLLNCTSPPKMFGCEFYTRYSGEPVLQTYSVMSGHNYLAQLWFTAVQDNRQDKLVEGRCVSSPGYSEARCLSECMERHCGCSDPLRLRKEAAALPPCDLPRFACLLDRASGKRICECKPSCRKMVSLLNLHSSPLNAIKQSFDPLYVAAAELDSPAVLTIFVRVTTSKTFNSMATETWITLMSSLGGVFNMFLGVGLVSALELVFWGLYRLPLAVRHSSEMETPFTHRPTTP